MAHNPFPDPAAVHPGEAEMLVAVLANLTDDLPKLVYADWLEERGDPRGVFLRAFTTAARSGEMLPVADGLSKSWFDLTGCRAVAAARELELPISPDELLKHALPALTFRSEPADDADLLIGQSKFGGEPDVPPGFYWPRYEGRPHGFLAQFNLMRLSKSAARRGLPREGLLSVFYSYSSDVFTLADTGGWRVFHFSDLDHLERRPSPDDLEQHDNYRPCRLTFEEHLSIADFHPFESDAHAEAFSQRIRGPLQHQLLGHARWMQGTPAFAEEPDKDGRPVNRHLLSLDSDDNPGWTWGDVGMLYFFTPADDLSAGRIDRTLFEFQCG
jgi:uncharacterized protein (TIGR02996 family)